MTQPVLHNQHVLITGAARRLGAQTARTLHANGANIAIHYRSSSTDADKLVAELNAARANSAIAVQADILDLNTHERLVSQVVDAFGGLSILINNASTFYPTPVGTITEAHWDDLIGSNLKGPLFLAQAAAPELIKARGAIINMVDIHAKRPLNEHVVYCCAKAGVHMLTESLAVELGPHVRVNGIAPGPVMWPENDMDEAEKKAITDTTLLKRTGEAPDIAKAALYFLAHAPFVTGQILSVDGGRSLRP
jgi:pteridine reductase